MAIRPDQTEKSSAVEEAVKIINQQRKYGFAINFYSKYKEPIKYVSTLVAVSSLSMLGTSFAQEAQSLFFQKFASNADMLTRIYSQNVMLSGFTGILGGSIIYESFIRRKSRLN